MRMTVRNVDETYSCCMIFSRSYCCTQYNRLFAWYCRLSVCLWRYVHCGCHGRSRGLKVVFLAGHFLLTSSNTFAVGCIYSHNTCTAKNRSAEISATLLFRRFRSAAIPYVVRSTIGLLSDSYASCCVSDYV